MKLLSKIAFLLTFAGLLIALLSLVGIKPRIANKSSSHPINPQTDSPPTATQPRADFRPALDVSHSTAQNSAENSVKPHVRIPAIRGENHYGWVQLPRGTRVELIRQSAGDLVVRWEGITVKVPQTAATTGAIALRQASHLVARN